MIKQNKILLAAFLPFLVVIGEAQTIDPYSVINTLQNKLEEIEDYQADIEIEVDVEFINMPVKHAQIFYKKPDKVKIKSDEFIMLPKRGLGKRITRILDEPYTAIYLDQETLNNELHHVIRIVPMGKNPETILSTWWINSETSLIARNQSSTRDEGTFRVDFIYPDHGTSLPSEMIFFFEIEKLSLPLKFIGKSSGMELDRSKMNKAQSGKVYIRFSNYRINKQLPDNLFEEDSREPESD